MRSQAALLEKSPGNLVVGEVEVDAPGPREVLIRTSAAGVCHSDLHFMEGHYPYPLPAVLGHESAGVVCDVGSDVQGLAVGDHVITCLSVFCGHCEQCTTGQPYLCDKQDVRRAADGPQRLTRSGQAVAQFLDVSSFSEYMLVHEHAAVRIRRDMPLDKAALIGCGVTTGLGAVFNTAQVRPGETVAVVGCGGIGLSAIQGASIVGAGRIVAVDQVPQKLELARDMGATDVVDASAVDDPAMAVRELTSGGVQHAMEAIGLTATAQQCFEMLRPGGTATVVGLIPGGAEVRVNGSLFLQERRIQGCNMGSNRFRVDMPRYVEMYLAGRLDLDSIITGTLPLRDINIAYERLKHGAVARQLITFD